VVTLASKSRELTDSWRREMTRRLRANGFEIWAGRSEGQIRSNAQVRFARRSVASRREAC